MKNETNTLDYVKTKKNTKNLKWRRAPIGKPTTKRQTQLDRIERKLDELLTRPNIVINPSPPGTWMGPAPHEPDKSNPNYEKAPWWMNPAIPMPTLTCNTERMTE